MSHTLKVKLKSFCAASGALMVAACGPLISFGDDGPPAAIYTLRYEGPIKSETPSGPVVYVDSPRMIEGLDGRDISVRFDDNRRTVLSGSAWSAHLPDLIRDYVTLALGSVSDANMVSEGGLDIKAGCRLGVKVWAMEFVPGQTIAEDKVEVAMQFSLVRLSDSRLLSHPTFRKSVGVSSSGGRGVVAAFSEAMEEAARDYGRWFKVESRACTTEFYNP